MGDRPRGIVRLVLKMYCFRTVVPCGCWTNNTRRGISIPLFFIQLRGGARYCAGTTTCSVLPLRLLSMEQSGRDSREHITPRGSCGTRTGGDRLRNNEAFIVSSNEMAPLPSGRAMLPRCSFLCGERPPSKLLLSIHKTVAGIRPPTSFAFSIAIVTEPRSSCDHQHAKRGSSKLPIVALEFRTEKADGSDLSF